MSGTDISVKSLGGGPVVILVAMGAASIAELFVVLERLEAALDARGFLYPAEKRPTMVRNLRNLFQRAQLTEQEVRTLHGIVSLLRPETDRDKP